MGEGMRKLKNLNPERVFYYFEEICKIPHGSGDTERISDFCEQFAIKHNLDYVREKIGNIIIKKSASKGKENSPTIIIQGHLDMVCEKNPDIDLDFLNDVIELNTDGNFIFANGTTLGGDDGIGVAIAMAILENDEIQHPALEVVFTVDEETGMYGAQALDASILKGKKLINIDSEEEGVFTVSCAGGARAELLVPVEFEENLMPCYKIVIEGLQGGHSGVDIDKGRLNANKVAANFLSKLKNIRIVSINGGLKDNAIPSYCQVIVSSNLDFENIADNFVKNNRVYTDSKLCIRVDKTNFCNLAMTQNSTENVIDFLKDVPNGIVKWSEDINGLVETSLNLGVLKTDSNYISASFAVRSSVNAEKHKLLNKLRKYVTKFNGKMIEEGHYPAWEYKNKSELRNKMLAAYKLMYGNEPKVIAIHAGLECGILSEKISGLDAVSIGPDMKDIHTPRERLSIASVKRVYEYIIKLLSII